MENSEIKDIYRVIENRSKTLIQKGNGWKREVASAKNYICTPDMKQWTFGKSVGLNGIYQADGGTAKWWLYSKGFTNILKFPDGKFKNQVIASFLNWAKQVDCSNIESKYRKDQEKNKRFELLVHKSLLKTPQNQNIIQNENQHALDDGFRKKVIREVDYAIRNRKIIELAKKRHGTKCAVCGFSFGEVYGFHGDGFIEIHHLNPIANGGRKTNVNDLCPVCANCHRMLHRGAALLSIKELKRIIKEANK